MGMLDYNPYYRCSKCKNRIHESKVPNSITGDVECCGQKMIRPGDPTISFALLSALCAAPLIWYLTAFGLWASLAAAGLLFVIVWRGLAYIRDLSKGEGPDNAK
jgi:hypothetical protein